MGKLFAGGHYVGLHNEKLEQAAHNFWVNIPWHTLTNKEIARRYGRCYCDVSHSRAIYAPTTLGKRVDWKSKIVALTTNEQEFVVADGFVQQSAARVAGYQMGWRLTQKTRKDRKLNLYLAGRK